MILYFTGTGNSRHIARLISKEIDDEVISINELIKSGSNNEIKSDKPFVIIAPTYAWRIPMVVEKFIKNTKLSGNKKVYFILTCGADTGDATSKPYGNHQGISCSAYFLEKCFFPESAGDGSFSGFGFVC